MNSVQSEQTFRLLSKFIAHDPKDPFGHKSQLLAPVRPNLVAKRGISFTFEECCVILVGIGFVGLGLQQLRNIYQSSRSLTPTFYELLEDLYRDQKMILRPPKIESKKPSAS